MDIFAAFCLVSVSTEGKNELSECDPRKTKGTRKGVKGCPSGALQEQTRVGIRWIMTVIKPGFRRGQDQVAHAPDLKLGADD